jgi:Fe-S-cluster-containing hydrogenase component 2
MVRVDRARCTGCGACVEVCPAGAIRLIQGATAWYAEVNAAKCQQCEACVQACPEQAIASESEPVLEGKVVQVKTTPLPTGSQPRQALLPWAPKAMTWLGPALAFVGREVVPRIATALLDAWDRRADRAAVSPCDPQPVQRAQQATTNVARPGRRRRRQRRGR